jgi:hypothetical protein
LGLVVGNHFTRGGKLGVYQPRHARHLSKPKKKAAAKKKK